MGALDSSLIFFLPLGIDFAVIILAARKPELFWLYALLATAGSVHRRHWSRSGSAARSASTV